MNFKLQLGQNQDIASPCSLNIIPKHLGHDPTSLINFPNAIPIQAFQKYKKQYNEVNGKSKRMLSASTLFRLISLLPIILTVPRHIIHDCMILKEFQIISLHLSRKSSYFQINVNTIHVVNIYNF